MLVDAHKKIAQMRNETRHIDAALVKVDAVIAFDDRQHLLDDAGHGVCGGKISGGEACIDQMQGQSHSFTIRQGAAQVRVHRIDQSFAFGVFTRVERTHFGFQWIFDCLLVLRSTNRTANMVG